MGLTQFRPIYYFLFLGMTCAFLVGVTQAKGLRKIPEIDPETLNKIRQRVVDWAFSPADLMKLAQLEYDLFTQFGSQSHKPKYFYEIQDKVLEEVYE